MADEPIAKPRSFYMYEVVDGGAGAVASYPHRLFVFNEAQELVEYIERVSGLEVNCVLEDEEAIEGFTNRLGVDEHHLWAVEQGRVVRHLDLEQFFWVDLGDGGRMAMSERELLGEQLARRRERLELGLDFAALAQALPRAGAGALAAEDGRVPVVWQIEKRRTHVGATVKLGESELGPGEDTFD